MSLFTIQTGTEVAGELFPAAAPDVSPWAEGCDSFWLESDARFPPELAWFEAVLPDVEGVLPGVEGVLPGVEGVLPRVEGVLPVVEGVLPLVEAVLSVGDGDGVLASG